MASEYDFQGPGVETPHPKKNWVNPDAKQVHFASGDQPRAARGASPARSGRSPMRLIAGLLGLVVLLAVIAFLVVAFVL